MKLVSELEPYMKAVMSNAQRGAYVTQDQFSKALNAYNTIMANDEVFDVSVTDIIFKDLVDGQDIRFKVVDVDTDDVTTLYSNLMSIKRAVFRKQTRQTVFLFNMHILNSGLFAHRNILMVDVRSGFPWSIFRIEPHGKHTIGFNPNDALTSFIKRNPVLRKSFVYRGEMYNVMPCKLYEVQKRLKGPYCVTYSVFIAYIIMHSMRSMVPNNVDAHVFERLSVPRQWYVFAKFMIGVYRIFIQHIKTKWPRTHIWEVVQKNHATLNSKTIPTQHNLKRVVNNEKNILLFQKPRSRQQTLARQIVQRYSGRRSSVPIGKTRKRTLSNHANTPSPKRRMSSPMSNLFSNEGTPSPLRLGSPYSPTRHSSYV
jgi:hypothetical protein